MASNQFYKGRTNNHLTWVMVDATDFATPESALSAATKIKIWGKLRGQAAANFVSSGTGSLTNDIQHVGPSVLGIYTIALAKADLSDASAAWYDQYIISLSATGAAYQTLIVDGGINDSDISALLSDLYSQLSDLKSDFQSRVPKAVATNSQLSDLHSDLRSFLVVMSGIQSDIYSNLSDLKSDFQSRVPKLVANSSQLSDLASDLKSAIGAITLSSDAISNIASAVVVGLPITSQISEIHAMVSNINSIASASPTASDIASKVWASTDGAAVASRVLQTRNFASDISSDLAVISGVISDIYSNLSDLKSDFQSRVPKLVATASQVSDLSSDLKSAVGNISVGIDSAAISDIVSAIAAAGIPTASDIASVVWTNTPGTAVASRVLQIRNQVSDLQSDFQSRVPKAVATNSQLSDLQSDLKSYLTGMSGVQSDIYSLLSDLHSDVTVLSDVVSNVYSNLTRGVNVTQLNGTSLNGDGAGTPWGP